MTTEPETDVDNDPEPESDRSMDKAILAMQRAIRIIKTLGPAERAYVLERLKQPN
jgi:hypothetical protein